MSKKIIAFLLSPFSFIYYLVISLRNHLYNINYTKSFNFEVPVINVGNLEAGGTGKTPVTEYLIRLLEREYHIATLSRGYGRKTKGFRIANEKDNAKTVGDEPYQYYLKYKERITVTVGEERAWAIPSILLEKPEINLILLDDAYQHRSVIPDINILLTSYYNPFYNDYILPSGRLREARKEAKRADVVIMTKCPSNISGKEMIKHRSMIQKYTSEKTPVFFTYVAYGNPAPYFSDSSSDFSHNILLVSGIAHNFTVAKFVKEKFNLIKHLHYNDHHYYSQKDIQKIKNEFKAIKSDKSLFTTEKDMTKLKDVSDNEFRKLPLFYLPIEVKFVENGKNFDDLILKSLKYK